MPNAPPIQRIPLHFICMCMHQIAGYFRRKDMCPLNISNMIAPDDQEVVWESLDAHVESSR